MRSALEEGAWSEVGRQIADEWDNRAKVSHRRDDARGMDSILAAARRAGAYGGKVCGAGGGGCLFCLGELNRLPDIRAAIAANGGRLLDFTIETEGLRVAAEVTA